MGRIDERLANATDFLTGSGDSGPLSSFRFESMERSISRAAGYVGLFAAIGMAIWAVLTLT